MDDHSEIDSETEVLNYLTDGQNIEQTGFVRLRESVQDHTT